MIFVWDVLFILILCRCALLTKSLSCSVCLCAYTCKLPMLFSLRLFFLNVQFMFMLFLILPLSATHHCKLQSQRIKANATTERATESHLHKSMRRLTVLRARRNDKETLAVWHHASYKSESPFPSQVHQKKSSKMHVSNHVTKTHHFSIFASIFTLLDKSMLQRSWTVSSFNELTCW